MQLDKRPIFFKILLNRFHPGARESLLQPLPSEEIREIFKQTTTISDPTIVLNWPMTLLSLTHYSWFVPFIKQMPQSMQNSVISSLTPSQAIGLSKLLKFPEKPLELPQALKQFFCHYLYKLWNPTEALPIDFLPTTQLSPLLNYNKNELVTLCDFLAMHDLAEAIRHIVDKKYLKAIYFCLTPKKQQFLRICLHKREKLSAPKFPIEKWDQKPETLQLQLHQRGLWRLGKALCGQHPSFIWHIIHRFDAGRGKLLSTYYSPEEIQGVTPILLQQLLFLMNFLKQADKA